LAQIENLFIPQPFTDNDIKTIITAGYPWLTPVILATQEAEIRRIVV
jgi:hypothetical protein